MSDRLLTAREVADVLGVSTETVLRWARRDAIPSITLPGGAKRFPEPALNAWLAERATPGRGVLPPRPVSHIERYR
jgi:excisionase family DNA binding protein